MPDAPQARTAVQALEGLPRDEQDDDRRDDARNHDRPQIVENHPVGVHQPHAVGDEEECHGPQQEPGCGTYRFGFDPMQAQGCEEQDHADDVT